MTEPIDATAVFCQVRRMERIRTGRTLRKLASLSPHRTVGLQAAARYGRRPRRAKLVFGGSMRVTPPDTPSMWIARYGYFEPEVMALMQGTLAPGSTFVDVGAHLGFFSLWAACLCGGSGHVYAIEPTPRTAHVLKANLVGADAAVTTIEKAALDREGTVDFVDFGPRGAAFNGPAAAVGSGHRATRQTAEGTRLSVKCTTLDALLGNASRVDCIKIDAEGSEGAVLDGTVATIQRHRPHLILETGDFSQPGRTRAVLDRILNLGDYVALQANDDFRVVPHQLLDVYPYGNVLLSPTERVTRETVES